MSERMKCIVCDDNLVTTWSDTHGVGVCWKCGCPYVVYQYDDNKKRIDAPSKPALTESGIDMAKRYWAEEAGMVFPGTYDMGFLGGRDRTYSGASEDDMKKFSVWYMKQPENVRATSDGE